MGYIQKKFVVIFGFLLGLNQAYAINCYSCGVLDSACNDPFKSSGAPTTECAGSCYKIKAKHSSSNAQAAIRGCVPTVATETKCTESSYGGITGTVCFCNGNLCNKALPDSDMESQTNDKTSRLEYMYSANTNTGDYVTCFRCGFSITERYIFHMNNQFWHLSCFRCCVCHTTLDKENSCFVKGDNIYCTSDYQKEFGTKCIRCARFIQSKDWVHRVYLGAYHLACFTCTICQKQLSNGDEYVFKDSDVVCAQHLNTILHGGDLKNTEDEQKNKRIRTNFNSEQLIILQSSFLLNPKPDWKELNDISTLTGLNTRVVQVWYQNARAKLKKTSQHYDNSQDMTAVTALSHNQSGTI